MKQEIVATLQIHIQINITNSRRFLTVANTVYSQVPVLTGAKKACGYFTEINAVFKIKFHNRHEATDHDIYFNQFYKGFISHLRHLYEGRKLPRGLK